jgi:signal transduction histidine kinase/DNA-binding response OmpR family regulator/PAS domain-containing protein
LSHLEQIMPDQYITHVADASARKQPEFDREQLLAELQAARAAAEANTRRQTFLAEASGQLAESRDYATTLANLARIAVPFLGDGCVIDLLVDGRLCAVDAAHILPEKAMLLHTLQRDYPQAIPAFVRTIFQTSQPVMFNHVPAGALEQQYSDPEQLRLHHTIAARAALGVPIRLYAQTLGTLAFFISESDRCYTHEDLQLAEELALVAARAIENAQLFCVAQAAIQRKDEALALLDTLVQRAPIGFAFMDCDLRHQIVNPQLAMLQGIEPAAYIGRTVRELIPALADRVEPLLRQVLKSGEPILDYELSDPMRNAPDQHLHRLSSYYPVRRHDGALLGVGALVVDVSKRKQDERALDQRVRLAALAADIGVGLTKGHTLAGMLQVCAAGLVHHLDAALARIWTLNEHDQVLELQASAGIYSHLDGAHGRVPVGMFKIGRIASERQPHLTNAVSTDPQIGDAEWARREGLVAFAGYPLIVEDRLIGVMALFARQPLTQLTLDALAPIADTIAIGIEHKQAETALIQERAQLARRVEERTADLRLSNAELARAARLKDEFLANMSHELRTPLNAILGRSEILQERIYGPLTNEQLEALHSIEESGRHLLALITDILDLSKIGADKLELTLETVDINAICQASLRLVAQTAQAKQIRLLSTIEHNLDNIQADQRRLKQILVNLLSNAVKFTPNGGCVGLEVHSDKDQHTATFTIWDTGIGIAAANLSRLFQPFVQLDGGLSRQYEGTGLGLALVQQLVAAHHGSVAVESKLGQGSRFTVTLPWHPASLAHSHMPAGHAEQPDTAPLEVHQVLVIDDSCALVEQISRYLADAGIRVAAHPHGDGAIERALVTRPDVIMLDIMLPDQTGWEVLRQLKANPQTQAIPVVIASVVDEPERGRSMGAAATLLKPIDRAELLDTLQKTINFEHAPATQPLRPQVLLAEDNQANVDFMVDYLHIKGYDVTVARDGGEVLAHVQRAVPDIILMDIQMPRMDGLTAIRHLRQVAHLQGVPIIALTALVMPGDRERCLQAGADDYLSKPVNLRTLLTTIDTHLGRRSAAPA